MDAVAERVAATLTPLLPELPGLDGLDLDRLAADCGRYCAALLEAHARVNLTGVREPEAMARLHILDSLLALPCLLPGDPIVDVGTGGGLPGVPLALARADARVVLIESRARKAQALGELVAEVGLAPRVSAVRARGEAWLAEHGGRTVLTRAVGAVVDQLELFAPVRGRLGRLVLLKGPAAADELEAARPRLERLGWPDPEIHATRLPGGDEQRVLLVFAGGAGAD